MSDQPSQPPEYSSIYRPQPPFKAAPFDSSAFDYLPFANQVVQTFQILAEGAVIAIDAPWGHGKTFFGRNLDARLTAEGWKTNYIDAFQHDFVEDPFLLLASAIKDSAQSKARRSFIKAASAVGKALLPITAKAVAKVATVGAISGDDLEALSKAAADASGDAASKLVENQIADFEKDKQTIKAFRGKIAELAETIRAETDHPLVVFIDELDRCRPDFAVRTLERMKHFFDVPYLVFVLLLNKGQLENAVNGVYGASINAEIYLRKFIHVTFQLPLKLTSSEDRRNEIGQYPAYLAQKIHLGKNQALVQPFGKAMSDLAPAMGLSFRDVERCFTLFVVSSLKIDIAAEFMPYLAFIIVLKVAFPDLYEGLVLKREEDRSKVNLLLQAAQKRGLRDYFVSAIVSIIGAHFGHQLGEEELKQWRHFLFRFSLEVGNMFTLLGSLLDSRLSR